MIWDLTNTALAIFAALLLYRFAPRFLAALKRFDENNRARIEREHQDRTDRLAHFRHAMDVAAEQVEEISETTRSDPKTGTTLTAFVFEGQTYAHRDDAEEARAKRIGDIARGFYQDLPRAMLEKRDKSRLS
jgi:hypothetical protein